MEDLFKSREALRALIDELGGLEDPLVESVEISSSKARAVMREHLM